MLRHKAHLNCQPVRRARQAPDHDDRPKSEHQLYTGFSMGGSSLYWGIVCEKSSAMCRPSSGGRPCVCVCMCKWVCRCVCRAVAWPKYAGGQCLLSKYQVAISVLLLGIINLKKHKNWKSQGGSCPPCPPPPAGYGPGVCVGGGVRACVCDRVCERRGGDG